MKVPRTRYLSNLCRICENIRTLNLEEALKSITESVTRCLGAKASSIRLLDRSGKVLEIAATCGLSKKYLSKGPVEVKKNPIDREALKGKAVAILDITKDKRVQYPRKAREEGLRSVLCVPLRAGKKTIGVLRVYTSELHEFSREEIDYLFTLASQGAAVIGNARLHQMVRTLHRIGKGITSHLNLEKVLNMIVENASCLTRAKGAAILLRDRETKTLEVSATYGLSEAFLKKGPISIDKSIKECLAGKVVSIPDAAKDKRVQYPEELKAEGIISILCVPLVVRKDIIGTLRIYTATRQKFSEEDIEFLCALADFGAIAIENSRLYEHMKRDYEDLTQDVWKWYDWGKQPPKI